MQMDNKIQEMARSMCRLSASLKCSECSDQCQYNDFAERLYNKGYRKASEVALEVIGEVEKIIDKYYNRHIFGVEDLSDVEQEAVINFSDDITGELAEVRVALAEANKERQELTEENERIGIENFNLVCELSRIKEDTMRNMREWLQERVKGIYLDEGELFELLNEYEKQISEDS